jgi:hypothetical protein
VRTSVFLFTLGLSCSGRTVYKAFATQGQEAFLDGHQHAFSELGGVPFDKIRYDNLKSATSRVLFGRNRSESDRWALFRSHTGLDAFYCQPGVGGAHEKGGVEGEGGRFRRTHLVPVPKIDSLAELNARPLAADRADDRRRITNRVRTVGQDFALDAPLLRPLPAEMLPGNLCGSAETQRLSDLDVGTVHSPWLVMSSAGKPTPGSAEPCCAVVCLLSRNRRLVRRSAGRRRTAIPVADRSFPRWSCGHMWVLA